MRSLRAATSALVSLAIAGFSRASLADEPADRGTAADDGSLVRILGGQDADLALHGLLALDLLAFRRTEVGFGPSTNVDLVLRTARLRLEVTPQCWAARFDLDLSGHDSVIEEAWVEYRGLGFLAVRFGRLRVPFGLAQNVEVADLKLMETPMIAGNPKDFRDIGVVVAGALGGNRMRWAFGAVTGSRDLAVDVNERPDAVGRLTFTPVPSGSDWVRGLHVGASGTYGSGPTRHGFRARTITGHTFDPPPTIRGVQWRVAGELEWRTPTFRIAAEVQRVSQARKELTDNQQIDGAMVAVGPLRADVISGWTTELSWHVWGARNLERPLTGIELCARYEHLAFGDGTDLRDGDGGTEDHAPLVDSHADAVTAGANFHLGHGVRLTAAWQAVWFGDETVAPDWVEPDPVPPDFQPGPSGPSHQVMLRAQAEL